jgi:hypothetical protein
VLWYTLNGLGFFDNEFIPIPTYFPSFIDYMQGCIVIGVNVAPISPCLQTAEEMYNMCFQPNSTANAGPDATIAESETFTPSATASNYDQISWSTTGNGVFSNPGILNPVYTPGTADIQNGYVTLKLLCSKTGYCEASDDLTLTILRQQQIAMQPGWQGFSSFIDLNGQGFDDVLAPIADRVIYAQNGPEVYWPEYGINTIGDFMNLEGYKIKLSAAATLPLTGFVFDQKTVNLPQGWSILPVLSGCPVDYNEIISQLGSNLVIVTEIGGTGVIWPANNVYTLPQLLPGKAYMIKATTNCSFTFPLCGE